MLPLVSVIIPVFNVKNYIDNCVESVCNQTYRNLDIILVDDGSQDDCSKICDSYAFKDPRIHSFHKKNGGLSDARNFGMKFAKGEFIFFLDGDDFISKSTISDLVNLQIKNESDIVICNMVHVDERVNNEFTFNQDKIISLNFNSEQAIEESIYQKRFSCSACGKLYRKSVLTVEFPFGKLSEDLAVSHIYLSEANTITYTNKVCYFYRQRGNSIMHQFNPKRLDALYFALQLEEFCKKNFKGLSKKVQCRVFNVAVHLLLDMDDSYIEAQNELLKLVLQQIKRTRFRVIIDTKCRIREKAVALLSFFGIKVMRFVWYKISFGRRKILK